MKQILSLVCIALVFTLPTPAQAAKGKFYAVPGRTGVTVPVWLIAPSQATDIVVLFSGGEGKLVITAKGIKHQANFLVRTRQMFADKGMIVAIPDKPSDKADLFGFRTTRAHAIDMSAVMQFLRRRYPGKPLWLVGTSRGTISVANVAAHIHGKAGPDGIVLTSSLTRGGVRNYDSLRDINLAAITVPTLVVHNRKDECRFTPFSDAEALPGLLTAVKVKAFKVFDGGRSPGEACQARSYHGYLGIEAPVVDSIVDWIKSH
ncbi:MAG: alpha/beta hydrolase [Gammaproteobacteria bacterium]|jgi:hypothetical protein